MPPTVQTSSSADRDRKLRPGEKKFVDYKPTSLERNYKHDLPTEHDLGVTNDLINTETYAVDSTAVLSMDDECLLEEDALTPKDSKRSHHHNKAVPWLKKTKDKYRVVYNLLNLEKLFNEENMYMDRDSQINTSNKAFSDNKIPVKNHYSKPNADDVYADKEPIFAHFQICRIPFLGQTKPVDSTKVEEMSQAMTRGDDSGETFVDYFLLTQETLNKMKRDAEDGVEFEAEEM